MLNTQTKRIFVFSLLVLVCTIGVFGFLVYKINTQGKQVENYLAIIKEKTAQENSFIRVKKLIQETEESRKIIDSVFFKDESESISFLGDIEKLAESSGLKLTTEGLDKVTSPDKVTEYVKMTFVYDGQREDVLNFTKLMENIPYHSWVENLELLKIVNHTWQGKLTLFITIQPS